MIKQKYENLQHVLYVHSGIITVLRETMPRFLDLKVELGVRSSLFQANRSFFVSERAKVRFTLKKQAMRYFALF